MARRKKKSASPDPLAEVPARVLKHIDALGFRAIDEYTRWCAEHGFAATTDKHWRSLADEKRAHDEEQRKRTERARLARNPRRVVEAVCRRELTAAEVTSTRLRPICDRIEGSNESPEARDSLWKLISVVNRKADFVLQSASFGHESHLYAGALIALNDRRGQWIRPLDEWKVSSHNRRKQFSSLARHLLARYDVPLFMDSVWFRRGRGSHRTRDWFVLIGSGGNLRSAKTPIPLTKKIAHHFMTAPANYTVEGAIRWGQVHSLGGDGHLCDALVATRLGASFDYEDFWVTVVRFFCRTPMLDRAHVGPIVDFLQNQRFEPRHVFVAPGVREQEPPPQPNLSMRGRTAESLLRQVEAWHERLGRARSLRVLQWVSSKIPSFELQTGRKGKDIKIWRIRELLSSQDLIAEGRAMHHCVATYAGSCANGQCSIWTMEVESFEGLAKRQTIEVNAHKVIVQSRGKRNVLPTQQEREMLGRWAQEADLKISSYIDRDW